MEEARDLDRAVAQEAVALVQEKLVLAAAVGVYCPVQAALQDIVVVVVVVLEVVQTLWVEMVLYQMAAVVVAAVGAHRAVLQQAVLQITAVALVVKQLH